MFVSFDDGASWEPFQFNLPATPVTDIRLVYGDLVLSTMGRGFWVMDDLAPLRQWSETVAQADAYLFQPSEAIRVRGGGGGFRGSSPDAPQWSRSGAVVDYWLGSGAGSVTIEIADGSGDVLHTMRSGGPGQRMQAGQGMRAPFARVTGAPNPGTSVGVHRVVWDFTFQRDGAASRGGPRVPPGTFEVRLDVDGKVLSRWVTVKIDPRVAEDGVTQSDLQEQFLLSLQILEAMDDASTAIDRLEEAMQIVAEGGDARSQLEEIHAALVTDRSISSYPQPMLADQLRYLYSMLQSADQKPGGDAYERLATLKQELEQHKTRMERVLRTIAEGDLTP
jgi:hypothetical protein